MADTPPAVAKLSGAILALALARAPLLAYVWETLNNLLSGHFDAGQIALATPALRSPLLG